MKKILCILLLAALAIPAFSQQKQQIGSVVVEGFKDLSVSKDQVTLSGPRVYIRTTDGKLEAKAQKIIIKFGPGGAQGGMGSLKSATLTGDVWMFSKIEKDKSTEARASSVDIDWAGARQAVLNGNVQIESTDPSMFAEPLTITADKATVNLKPDAELKDGETRIRIESDPGKSKMQFTPVAKPKTEENKQG
ncbi:MAG: hypothetical protein ABFD64_06670 [Armatimonadota bacterium]